MHLSAQDLIGWRMRMRLSRADLAHELNVDPSTVKRWERSERAIPPYLHLALDSLQLELV
jgi:DNA-binding transcriptional regulator YiaG